MARLPLNKATLHREEARLRTYRRFLPSLDLKRRQLIAARAAARRRLATTEAEIEDIAEGIARELPMLADHRIGLEGLAAVTAVSLGEENLLGVRVPVLGEVTVRRADYGFLARPHWVDAAAERLESCLRLRVRAEIERRRLALLETAVTKITQRVNLFDRVLIPRTRANLRRIGIHLADAGRAGVVRAKLAKRRRAPA